MLWRFPQLQGAPGRHDSDMAMAGSHWPGCKHMGSKHRQVDVPQQPLASGSCAINAANTIERTINPAVERWTHPRSVRAMKLLTGYSTVRLAVELVTIAKQLLIFFPLKSAPGRLSFRGDPLRG